MVFIFFSLILLFFFFLNYYVFKRSLEAMPNIKMLKTVFTFCFWTLAGSYFLFKILERHYSSGLVDTIGFVGALWMGAFIYILLFVVFFDIIRLVNSITAFYPEFIVRNYELVKNISFAFTLISVVIITSYAYYNARRPVVKTIEIKVEKDDSNKKSLNTVLISDIHLGSLSSKSFLKKVKGKINSLNPDYIFIAGDIIDDQLKSVKRRNLGFFLNKLNSNYGVYGVLGNHEYIGGVEKTYNFLIENNVIILRDSIVKTDNGILIIGRDDISSNSFSGIKRKSLEELLNGVDMTKPSILIDHQPYHIKEAESSGVDILLSGHTHHGQLWPINYITSAIFDLSRGYKKYGNMHLYVSSGIGTWGPPLRLGSKPEIINIKIVFSK